MKEVDYIDLLGKPFQLGARGPRFYDCWGLCLEMGKRAGIDYPADFTPEETEKQSEAICDKRDSDFDKLDEPEPFCIVTFTITPPFVDHCGIVLPDCKHFLHIMHNHSVAVQRLDHRILAKRIDGYYKLRDNNADN